MKSTIKRTIYINQDTMNLILAKHFKENDLEVSKFIYDVSTKEGLYGVTLLLQDEEIEVGI